MALVQFRRPIAPLYVQTTFIRPMKYTSNENFRRPTVSEQPGSLNVTRFGTTWNTSSVDGPTSPLTDQQPPFTDQLPPMTEQHLPLTEQHPPLTDQHPPLTDQLPPMTNNLECFPWKGIKVAKINPNRVKICLDV